MERARGQPVRGALFPPRGPEARWYGTPLPAETLRWLKNTSL